MSHSVKSQSPASKFAALGFVLLVAGCASGPPPGPTVLVLPGQNKDLAAFQQDDAICRQHAVAHTGFGESAAPGVSQPAGGGATDLATEQPGSGAAGENAAVQAEPADKAAYAQCMASRGDVVRLQPSSYAAVNGYGYPYLDPYAYWYGYPYAFDFPFFFYGGGFYHGFGWSHEGVYRGVWHGRGFAGRGFARGGFGHGGFARAGGGRR
jgi:hypothetical protein